MLGSQKRQVGDTGTQPASLVSLVSRKTDKDARAKIPPLEGRRQRPFAPQPLRQAVDTNGRTAELDKEEPLSGLFQRALVLQRAGSIEEALENYKLFWKAAQQCEVDPFQYAEVHVNMGVIYMKKGNADSAKDSFNEALKHRNIGTAHVNLAVLQLQQASSSISPQAGLKFLLAAKEHCQRAVLLDDELRSFETASRLLKDIDRMVNQVTNGRCDDQSELKD